MPESSPTSPSPLLLVGPPLHPYPREGKTGAKLWVSPCLPSPEVTSDTFNKEGFLLARGLTRGYWIAESMLVRAPDYGLGLQKGCAKTPVPFLQSGEWGLADAAGMWAAVGVAGMCQAQIAWPTHEISTLLLMPVSRESPGLALFP